MIPDPDYTPTQMEKDDLLICGWVEVEPGKWVLPGYVDWGLTYLKARREQDRRNLWGV